MNAFEDRFAASLKSAARELPPLPRASTEALDQRPRRTARLGPLLAAAAVLAVVGGGSLAMQQLGPGGQQEGFGPAESGGVPPSSAESSGRTGGNETSEGPPSRDMVTDVTEKLAGFHTEPGFGKVVVDYASAMVTIFWSGPVPDAVRSEVGTQSNGVVVVLRAAGFSEAEFVAAGKRVMDAGRDQFGSGALAAAYPSEDMSRLVVEATRQVPAEPLTEAAGEIPIIIKIIEGSGPVLTGSD